MRHVSRFSYRIFPCHCLCRCMCRCTAIIDTGTYLIYGPKDDIKGTLGSTMDIQSCDDLARLPSLTFVLWVRRVRCLASNLIQLTRQPAHFVNDLVHNICRVAMKILQSTSLCILTTTLLSFMSPRQPIGLPMRCVVFPNHVLGCPSSALNE